MKATSKSAEVMRYGAPALAARALTVATGNGCAGSTGSAVPAGGAPAFSFAPADESSAQRSATGTTRASPSTSSCRSVVTPTSGPQWQQVLAIRIAVLARSQNYERPQNPGDPCSATTTANIPKWGDPGSLQDFPTLLVAGVLPSCYKYRVFETIVPLRNMIWRPA